MEFNGSANSTLVLTERILSNLDRVDNAIMDRHAKERYGLLAGLGGCSMYFLNRYFQTQDYTFHNESINLLEKIIRETNEGAISNPLNLGSQTITSCWLIDQYIKLGALDVEEKTNSKEVIAFIIGSTTQEELDANRHDLFYGFLGNAVILLENDFEANRVFLKRVINALKKNSICDNNGIYWKSPFPFFPSEKYDETLNFGIPHGSLGIVLFLLKCYSIEGLDNELEQYLTRSLNWLINRLNQENNQLHYQYGTKSSGTGRLGWCYGDQAIAYTLLRFHEVLDRGDAKIKAFELIEQSAKKTMNETGVQFFSDYGYYDLRICHGTSSIAYMYKKMYDITQDQKVYDLVNKWLDITLDNLDIYLAQIDVITEKEKDNSQIDTSMGFLNGLSGVGLTLISFLEPNHSYWDKILLLDRPGKE